MTYHTICRSLRFAAAYLLLAAMPLFAQTTTPSPSGNPPMGRRGGSPCLQKAGIERSVMEQIHSIQSEAHSQIAAVCENSSLTPQQKHEQVQQIREQAKQKMDALITPQQQEALHACQQQMGMNHPGMGHPGAGGGCGESAHPNQPNGTSNNPSGSASAPPQH